MLKDFSNWLSTSHRKPSTIKNLITSYKLLDKRSVNCLSYSSVSQFILQLKTKGLSSSHINNLINFIKVFIHFADESNIIYDPELKSINYVKDRYRPRATMTDKEIDSFLSLPRLENTGKVSHLYWKTYFSIVAYTGMRTGEAAKLKVENVDFSQGLFYLLDTKTNDNRIVPIPLNIKDLVYEWVQHVKKGYLFYSGRPEGHTSSVEWNYQFHKRIKRLGIQRTNLVPYSLRHSYATEMLQTEGVNVFDVKNLLGHHDIKMTENYYHLSSKRLKAVSQKHPGVRSSATPQEIFRQIEEYLNNLNLDQRFSIEKTVSEDSLAFKIKCND